MPKWRMAGSILGACNCDWGCPCNFDVRPSKGYCQGIYVLAIKTGQFGTTKFDGLHALWAGSFPAAIHEGNGTSVGVIDENANASQRAALERLQKGGGVGLPFDIFAKVTATWLDTVYAPFEVKLNGIRSTARVGSGRIYDLQLSRVKNPVTGSDEQLYLDKPTGFTSKRTALGMSVKAVFRLNGMSFDNTGQYGEFGKFAYSGEA